MRRIIFAVLVILSASTTVSIYAQDEIRTASPSIVAVELSGIEPVPAGIASEIAYSVGGMGGGGGEELIYQQPFWVFTPLDLEQGGLFTACGYSSQIPPMGKLTFPDKHQSTVSPDAGQPTFTGDICWTFTIPWQYGMQLGMYTFSLESSDGDLSHMWGIDYPYCGRNIELSASQYERKDWLMGLPPNELLSLYFYADFGNEIGATFVAVRHIQSDSEGAVILDITSTFSAPFSILDPTGYSTVGYFIVDVQYGLLLEVGMSGYQWQSISMPAFTTQIQSKYSTYNIGSMDCRDDDDSPSAVRTFDGFGRRNYIKNDYAQIAGSQESKLTMYESFDDLLSYKGDIEVGIPIVILSRRVAMVKNKVEVWYRLRTEDDREGWIYGKNLIPIWPNATQGSQAIVTDDFGPTAVLYSSPHIHDKTTNVLAAGTKVTLISKLENDEGYWTHIQLTNGDTGWLQSFLEYLPWKPLAVASEN